jgi:hypothetical protein
MVIEKYMQKNNTLVEGIHGHGALRSNPVSHWIRNKKREQPGKAVQGFDWKAGYDSLSMIPPVNIKNQFQSYSCGGQAASYALEIVERLANNQEGALSAKSIYAPKAVAGGGMYVTDLQTMITSFGSNLEADTPSYKPDGTTDEPFMSNPFTVNPKEALKRAGYIIVNVPVTMDGIASAIKQYGAVVWEITGQNNQTWTSSNPQPPINNLNLWNHFMCGVGAGQPTGVQRLKFLQSWGTSVGEKGIQYFNANYVNSGYVRDCFSFYKPTLVPTTESPAQINFWGMFWANIKAYWAGKPLPYPTVPIGSSV